MYVDFPIRRTWGEWPGPVGLSIMSCLRSVVPPTKPKVVIPVRSALKKIHKKTVPVTHQPTPTGFGHWQVQSSHSASRTTALPDK